MICNSWGKSGLRIHKSTYAKIKNGYEIKQAIAMISRLLGGS